MNIVRQLEGAVNEFYSLFLGTESLVIDVGEEKDYYHIEVDCWVTTRRIRLSSYSASRVLDRDEAVRFLTSHRRLMDLITIEDLAVPPFAPAMGFFEGYLDFCVAPQVGLFSEKDLTRLLAKTALGLRLEQEEIDRWKRCPL